MIIPRRYTLSPEELSEAAAIGVRRHIASIERPNRNGFVDEHGEGWHIHIEGACGELAAARVLEIEPMMSVNTFGSVPDIGGLFDVRTRSKENYELKIKHGDVSFRPYVLARGKAPTFDIVGWMVPAQAWRNQQWIKSHGGRTAVWFVPDASLYDVGMLMGERPAGEEWTRNDILRIIGLAQRTQAA